MLIWRQRLPVASTSQGTTKSTGRHQKLDETKKSRDNEDYRQTSEARPGQRKYGPTIILILSF